jgi:hypothetical protein
MRVQELKQLVINNLNSLNAIKTNYKNMGDVENFYKMDNEIAETQSILDKLQELIP